MVLSSRSAPSAHDVIVEEQGKGFGAVRRGDLAHSTLGIGFAVFRLHFR